MLTGGFPCQDISNAGKRAGIKGSRSSLWKHYARAISEIRPRIVFIENVAALTQRGLDTVLCDLAKIGYDAEWHCIPASAVGAPHKRDRIIILGYSEHVGWDAAKEQASIIEGSNDSEEGAESTCELTRPSVEHATLADTECKCKQGQQPKQPHEEEWQGPIKRPDRSCGNGLGWWSVEPDVGGTLDGFSSWLDENRELQMMENYINSHKLLMAYANAEEIRPRKVVQILQDTLGTEAGEWSIRGQGCIPPTAVLFTYLCQFKEGGVDKTRLQLAGEETPQEPLRELSNRKKSSRAPHQSKHSRQSEREHTDSLQALSRLLALNAEKAWIAYRGENAVNNWESGINRVAYWVPLRVERIKRLGNAVVPQWAQAIGEAINERERGT